MPIALALPSSTTLRGFIKRPHMCVDPLHPLSRGMILCLPLGGVTTGIDPDLSLFGSDGTPTNGPTLSSSHHGGLSSTFNGSNQYVAFAKMPVTGAAPFTISCWMKTSTINTAMCVVYFGSEVNNQSHYFATNTSNVITANIYGGFGTATGTKTVTDGNWHHVVSVFNGSTFTVLTDGGDAVTGASCSANLTARAGGMTIGRDVEGSNQRWFTGSIEGVRIYNRALSRSEVSWLFAEPYAGLVPKSLQYTVGGSIFFDGTSNSGYKTSQSTYTWNHTCSGSNRYLTVGISMLSVAGSSVTGITYNGVALSLINAKASVSGAVRAELWGLVAPSLGTNVISVTLSTGLDSIGEAISFTQVDQTTPYEGVNNASATNVGAADATVNVSTTSDKDWCVDIVATDDTSITVGAGQIQRNNVTGTLGSGGMSTEGMITPSGTVTMSWTNVGALATWSIVSVALRPITASSSGFFWWSTQNNYPALGTGIY